MRSEQIKQIFRDPDLADELLSLNQKILDHINNGLSTITSLRDLAQAWQRWQKFHDDDLIRLVSGHSEKILACVTDVELLINFWYATPVKKLRILIVQRLESLITINRQQIVRLAQIYSKLK